MSMALTLSISSSSCRASICAAAGAHPGLNQKKNKCVQNLLKSTVASSPLESLQRGNWVKLICGASFEDVVDIRNLSLVYTLAGVDCIDCAADASVVSAVNEGIDSATHIAGFRRPWVMISVNDDEDLHFRKAEFDPDDCPIDCSRPCELVCPANAISFQDGKLMAQPSHGTSMPLQSGVITERCYGCGRCFPVCPYDKIREKTYVRDIAATAELLQRDDVDAIEIHTSGRQTALFHQLWNGLGDSIMHLRLVAVSLTNTGDLAVSTMNSMYSIMEPQLCNCSNLWQLDGRPMSGDIGRGATREAIAFAVHLASRRDKPPGFLQLAGGTNSHTVKGLQKEGLFQTTLITNKNQQLGLGRSTSSAHALISGIAYGGYARMVRSQYPNAAKLYQSVGRVLKSVASHHGLARIEDHPEYLEQALKEALALVGTVKCYQPSSS